MIFHLKHLFKIFCVFVRPIIEYASPTYHSMLTKRQSDDLEVLQRQTIRICFRFQLSASQIMTDLVIKTLTARRIRRVDTFIMKALNYPRFGPRWLAQRQLPGHQLRNARVYEESMATKKRYFNSPLSYKKRRLKEIGAWLLTLVFTLINWWSKRNINGDPSVDWSGPFLGAFLSFFLSLQPRFFMTICDVF